MYAKQNQDYAVMIWAIQEKKRAGGVGGGGGVGAHQLYIPHNYVFLAETPT